MTVTFFDMMALARRTLLAGDADLAGQMACLAMESLDAEQILAEPSFSGEEPNPVQEQQEEDDDETMAEPMLDALEDGDSAMPGGGIQNDDVQAGVVAELKAVQEALFRDGFMASHQLVSAALSTINRSRL